MILFFTSSDKSLLDSLQDKISMNCGFPNENGTEKWADVLKAYGIDLYYFPKPNENGYQSPTGLITYDEMMAGTDLTGIETEEYNPAWRDQSGDN